MNAESVNRCPKCQASVPAEAPQGLCPKCLLASAAAPTEVGQAAEAAPPPTLQAVAASFPQLEILEFVGQGGMGMVYKARQPKLDRLVALKLLPRTTGVDPAFGERFNREARVLARLSHPNIVAVHDFGQAGAFYYLVMEFVDGVNLRQAMRAGRFTPAQALALVPRICDALQYAHEEGVLHRDIKPENLLLDTRGRVKIADFGIAKLQGEVRDITLTASGAAMGTPHYMAPEQLEHPHDVDQRADIYSLGVVFYEMLTGELPLGRFAPPSEKSTVDARIDEVVFRALEKERERRYQSAGEVKTRIETITGNPGGSASGVAVPPPVPAGGRIWSNWTVAAVTLGVMCFVTAVILMAHPDGESMLGVAGLVLAGALLSRAALVGIRAAREPGLAQTVGTTGQKPSTSASSPDPGTGATVVVAAGPRRSKLAIAAAILAVVSLPGVLVAVIGSPNLGEWLALMLMMAVPALAGAVLGWWAVRDIRASQGRLQGERLAEAAAATSSLLVMNSVVFIFLTLWFHQPLVRFFPSPGHILAEVVVVLILDGLALWYWLKRSRPKGLRVTVAEDLQWFRRLPRVVQWGAAAAVLLFLLIFVTQSRRTANLQQPAVQELATPDAPPGYEVPPGSLPADDRTFQSALTVPGGYALTLTTTLSSNQVVVQRGAPAMSAFLVAPPGQNVDATLKWRFLGNTIAADGAPVEFSLGRNQEGDIPHAMCQITPPQALAIDWVGEPPQIWPPRSGHTKFLLARGKPSEAGPTAESVVETGPELATPGATRPSGTAEWTLGIEVRLDPLPLSMRKMRRPVAAAGTNWLSALEPNLGAGSFETPASPSSSDQSAPVPAP